MGQSSDESGDPEAAGATAGRGDSPEGVGDALRTAVERTLAVTADSATETRQRAQSLLDDVVRRGQVARDEVTRRGEEATTRLADAISDLRTADVEEVGELRDRLAGVERRLASVEARLTLSSNPEVEAETKAPKRLEQADSG